MRPASWAERIRLASPARVRRLASWAGIVTLGGLSACSLNPARPFDRQAPSVVEAIEALDAGDAAAAAAKLEEYLSTGACKDGSIGTPDGLTRRPDGTFDLGVALFRVGEQFGRRFGDEEIDAGVSEAARAQRHAQVTCARRLVQAIGDATGVGAELGARARYLDGNLAFLDGEYEDAVRAYDGALVLAPGQADGGDEVGRDAAWNRAIALRRIDDRRDAGGPDASGDASPNPDAGRDGGDDRPKDAGRESGSNDRDGGRNSGSDAGEPPPPPEPDGGDNHPDAGPPPPPPATDQDERMLDQLENAPTLQQEEAKRYGRKRVRGMADK
jgi:hypothetical protein